MTLTRKMLSLALLPLLLGGGLIAVVGLGANERAVREGATQQAVLSLGLHAEAIESFLAGHRATMRVLAASEVARAGDLTRLRPQLALWEAQMSGVEALCFNDQAGIVYNAAGETFSIADRYYFPRLRDGGEVVTRVLVSRVTGRPSVMIFMPIRDGGGRQIGSLGAAVTIVKLADRLGQVRVGETGYAALLDDDGNVVCGAELGKGDRGRLSAAVQGKVPSPVAAILGGERCRVFYHPIRGNDWTLALVHKDADVLARIHQTRLAALAMLLIGVVFAVGGTLAARLLVLGPIRRLMENQGRVAEGDLTARVQVRSQDELGQLAGSFNQMAAALEDATARVQRSEALFRSQFELGNIGMAITSPDRYWLLVNRRLCEMLGYTAEELRERTWSEMTHPDDLQADLEQFQSLLSGEIDAYELPKRFLRRDGGTVATHLTVSCQRDADGAPQLVMASLLDTTEQERVAAELRRATEETSALNRLTRAVTAQPGLSDACRVAADQVAAALGADAALIFLREEDALVAAAAGPADLLPGADEMPVHRVGECLCGLAAHERRPQYSTDTAGDPRCTMQECRAAGMRSFAAVPMVVGDEVMGVLGIGTATERDFRRSEAFLTAVADQLALSLHNARLYDQTLQHAAVLQQEVAERRQAQEALVTSQRQLQDIAANIPGVIFQFWARDDGEMGIGYVSEGSMELFGIDPRAAGHFERVTQLVDVRDRERFSDSVASAVRTQGPWRFEGRLNKATGESVWISGMSSPRRQSDRLVYNGVILDITESKRAEDERDRLGEIIEATPDLVGTATPDGLVSYLNAAGKRLAGWDDRDGQEGKLIAEMHPPWAYEVVSQVAIPTACEEGLWQGETALLGPDGAEVPVHQIVMAHRGDDGELHYLSTIMRDITAGRRAEQALLASERRFRAIFENAGDAILVTDVNGVLDCNTRALELFECTREAIIGPYSEWLSPPLQPDGTPSTSAAIARMEAALRGETQSFEWTHCRLDGTPFDAEITLNRVATGQGYVLHTIIRDVTDRRRAERALLESEAKFRALFENAGDAIFLIDDDTFVECNSRALEMFGGRREDIVGRHPGRLSPELQPDGLPSLEKAHRVIAGALGGVPQFFEWCHSRIDGTPFDVEVTLNRLFTQEGYVVLAIVRDVTERKRAERALQESEARFRALFDNAGDAIVVIDGDVLVDCNSKTLEVFGCARDDIIGHSVMDFSPASQPDGTESAQAAAVRAKAALQGTPQFFEWQHRKTDGTLFDAEVSLSRVGTGQGHLVQGVIRDVTERRRIEQELRESELRFRTVFDLAPMAILVTDTEGRYVDANLTACRHAGLPLERLIGRRLSDVLVFDAQDYMEQMVAELGLKGALENREVTLTRRADDTRLDILFSAAPITVAGRELVLSAAIDVTQQNRLEEQLRQSQKMEAIGQLAGGVAHDFNNILQAILGYTDMVLGDLSPEEPHYAPLTQVYRAGERAAGLTQQLLAFSRRQLLQLAPVDLNHVVEDLMRMVRRLIGEDIELMLMPGHELWPVSADRGQLEQVLMNLCVNARDAMPEGGRLTIETRNVEVDQRFCEAHDWAKPGRYVLLNVSDSGTGMDAATLGQIFDPFFSTKGPGKGTGLGLAMVYGIIRQHDGMVQVYSEPGAGTTFHVYIPTSEESCEAALTETEEAVVGGTETILLAEDSEQARLLIEQILWQAGYRVLVAADGEEALELYRRHGEEVDLLLLDVVMPRVGGRAAFDQIRRSRPDARCVFVSGYSEGAVHTDFILDEGLQLVQKPYHRNDLLRTVRQVLDAAPRAPGT